MGSDVAVERLRRSRSRRVLLAASLIALEAQQEPAVVSGALGGLGRPCLAFSARIPLQDELHAMGPMAATARGEQMIMEPYRLAILPSIRLRARCQSAAA